MEAKDAQMREIAIFDMVTEYLHNRELFDAEKLVKKQRNKLLQSLNNLSSTIESPRKRSNNQTEGVTKSRLEDLIEKSWVTDFVSGSSKSNLVKRSSSSCDGIPIDDARSKEEQVTAMHKRMKIDPVRSHASDGLKIATKLVCFEGLKDDPYGSSAVPLYQTATFKQPGATTFGQYDYTRSGNPTRSALERHVAELEGGIRAFSFGSGMAALNVVTRLVKAGDEIICADDSYGGTYRLLSRVTSRQGVSIKYVNLEGDAGPRNLRQAMSSQTKLVMVETPTNPFQRICDLKALAEVAHSNGALISVDNTMMSPLLQRPLDFGIDIVCHSATKFICGHSDTMAGVVIVNSEELAKDMYFFQNAEGNALAPFDCWLLLRGIKTMGIRVYEQQRNAVRIAEFLQSHPLVKKVYYCGLPSHENYNIHSKQSSGGGSVVSFETGNLSLSSHIVTATKLFNVTVSFGSVDSRIELPGAMSHASIPVEVRAARSFPEDIVRISIGIEDVDDLIADLSAAFQSYATIDHVITK